MTPAHKKHESFWRLVTLTVGLLFVVAMVLLTGCGALDIVNGFRNGRIGGCGVIVSEVAQ